MKRISRISGIRSFTLCTIMTAAFVFLLPLTCSTAHAASSAIYIAQAASGAANGSSCQNAMAVSFFNSSSNWGSGSNQIGPGTTVHLCGVVSAALTVFGSGASGNPITIQWESGASVQACVSYLSGAAVTISARSYLILDLGGNSAAITCPNNGTSKPTQVEGIGIGDSGNGMNNVEVRNGTIGPIFVHDAGGGSLGNNSLDVSITGGGSNLHFHNLTFTDAAKGILIALSGTSSGNSVYSSSFQNTGSPTYYACGNTTNCVDTGGTVHDNDFNIGTNWAGSGMHQENLHLFSQTGPSTTISGFLFYNNFMHGSWANVGGTSAFEVSQAASGVTQGTSSGKVFNNLCVFTGGTAFPGDGCFYVQNNNNTWEFYNNVVDCINPSSVSGKGFQLDSQNGSAFTVKNNIVLNCNVPYYDEASTGTTGTATINNNIYYNNGSFGWYWKNVEYSTFSAWQASPISPDANGSTANPGLNADYTIPSTTSLANNFGANLTNLGLTALDTGGPQTFGASGSCGTGCVGRLPTGSWASGVYALSSGTTGQNPNPPTGLAASVQ